MDDFKHQEPDELKAAFARHLEHAAQPKISAAFDKEASSTAAALCASLVEYAAYTIGPEPGVNPFDDPYVAAALITKSGVLISAHRKERRHEPHAEAVTMLRALESIDSEDARKLSSQIRTAYDDRLWLRSELATSTFVDLFRAAGELLKRRLNGDEPILISTLEPCCKFETQPSCSHLISAFGISVVMYACDDTNSKGQGRPVLEERGLRVFPNLAVDSNLKANRLFYATIYHLTQLQKVAAAADNPFRVYYSATSLSHSEPRADTTLGRTTVGFSTSLLPHIYEAHPEASVSTEGKVLKFDSAHIDPSRVFYATSLDDAFMLRYLAASSLNVGKVPGMLVCARSGAGLSQRVIRQLQRAGIQIHLDVMRRPFDELYALEALSRARDEYRSADFAYIVAKAESGYQAFSGDRSKLFKKLLTLTNARRVTIYIDSQGRESILNLLRRLRDSKAFERPNKLSAASVYLIIVASPGSSAAMLDDIRTELRGELNLAARVSVTSIGTIAASWRPRQLRVLVAGRRLDPVAMEHSRWLELLDSESWQTRQLAGWMISVTTKRDPGLFDALILKPLPESFQEDDWRRTCSLLNALAKYGRPHETELPQLFERLKQLALSLPTAVKEHSVAVDVAWRLTAALFAVSTSIVELKSIFSTTSLEPLVCTNGFLLRELFTYAGESVSGLEGKELAFELLNRALPQLSTIQRSRVLLRATRSAAIWNDSSFIQRLTNLLISFPQHANECKAELDRCIRIMNDGLPALFSKSPDKELLFPTYLFIRTAQSGPSDHKSLVGAVSRELSRLMGHDSHSDEQIVSWRGDKTPLARLLLAELSDPDYWQFLSAAAQDEDETIRWVSLVLAFDREGRGRRNQHGNRRDQLASRTMLATIVNHVLTPPTHYWLQREFLDLFCAEHTETDKGLAPDGRVQLIDSPPAQALLNARDGDMHPEVRTELDKLRRHVRKITLVLPPIANTAAVSSSTPPLGLGSLATKLAADGHEVEILDCHRHPDLVYTLPDRVRNRDLLGFGVVASTFDSTRKLVAMLKTQLGDACPAIVLGGHAVTLQLHDFLNHDSFAWDFLIVGDGEEALAALANSLESADAVIPGLIRRSHQRVIQQQKHQGLTGNVWDTFPWIDRRFFVTPNGARYEPTLTRDGRFREAHIVLSRGCAWKCSFCTEAILRGTEGEIRRSPTDALCEIEHLMTVDDVRRIQFIDDNFLPQIATQQDRTEECVRYATTILDGLQRMREKAETFGWRAIFRFEDFLAYASTVSDWYGRLRDSGCLLIAFGVEHGIEKIRRHLKGGSVSNEEIVRTVETLRSHGIVAKGYFIIGGPHESVETAAATVNFAINSQFGLAYFAIYKYFRSLVKFSERPGKTTSDIDRLLRFGTLSSDFDQVFESTRITGNPRPLAAFLGFSPPEVRLKEALNTFSALQGLHFSFSDLFKYNDFHDWDGVQDKNPLWSKETPNQHVVLMQAIRRAYFEFYLRPAFIEIYQNLTAKGY